MDSGFIDILKQLVKEQGNAVLEDVKRAKALLADYTKNEYRKQSRLLLQTVEDGITKAINGAEDLSACKKAKIKELEEEGISPEFAADIVNTLVLILRGDTTVKSAPVEGRNIYEGDVANGKGKITYAGGNVYEGDFVNYNFHGKGRYVFNGGDVYEGDFVRDQFHGKGKWTRRDGGYYEGDFVHDSATGKGKYVYTNGDVYEGDFLVHSRHGKGKMIYADGRVEEGKWEKDKFVGK